MSQIWECRETRRKLSLKDVRKNYFLSIQLLLLNPPTFTSWNLLRESSIRHAHGCSASSEFITTILALKFYNISSFVRRLSRNRCPINGSTGVITERFYQREKEDIFDRKLKAFSKIVQVPVRSRILNHFES